MGGKASKRSTPEESPETIPRVHKMDLSRKTDMKTRENSGLQTSTPTGNTKLNTVDIKCNVGGIDNYMNRTVASPRTRLSDAQVLRLVEAAMDELTLSAEKVSKDFKISEFPRTMPIFSGFFRNFLL